MSAQSRNQYEMEIQKGSLKQIPNVIVSESNKPSIPSDFVVSWAEESKLKAFTKWNGVEREAFLNFNIGIVINISWIDWETDDNSGGFLSLLLMKIENVGERGTTEMKAREFQTNEQIFAYVRRQHVNPEW